MTMVDIKEAFTQCQYPYYKNVEIQGQQATCTIYSAHSDYKALAHLPTMNFDALIHRLSLEIIKVRSAELAMQQQQIIEKGM